MIITYLRSSSYNQFDFCPHSYFLNYVLGIPEESNQKAEMGTICHKVFECLGKCKKCEQEGETLFVDRQLGEVKIKGYKKDSFVDSLFEKSFSYYVGKSPHTYKEKHKKDCLSWVYKALTELGCAFDPRIKNIIDVEPHFDITFEEDWAKYSYDIDGKKIEGHLSIKGTIDLIDAPFPSIYESTDWKTGRRLDWATGEEKTYKKLRKDPQLRLYHLALSYMYPKIESFIPTIFFINDGGVFTLPFNKGDLEDTKEMIRERFNQIKNTVRPQLKKSWKCKTFCYYGKHDMGRNKVKESGNQTICECIAQKVRERGIDYVTENYKEGSHQIDSYQSPGE